MDSYKEAQSRDYFNQVVKEVIKDLNMGRAAYCFSAEQIEDVKIRINKLNSNPKTKLAYTSKDLTITDDDGFYYITGPVKPKKQGRKKTEVEI